MYIVRNTQGEIVAITTRKSDAECYSDAQKIDRTEYKITVDNTAK